MGSGIARGAVVIAQNDRHAGGRKNGGEIALGEGRGGARILDDERKTLRR